MLQSRGTAARIGQGVTYSCGSPKDAWVQWYAVASSYFLVSWVRSSFLSSIRRAMPTAIRAVPKGARQILTTVVMNSMIAPAMTVCGGRAS